MIVFPHIERTGGAGVHGWFWPYTGPDERIVVNHERDVLPVLLDLRQRPVRPRYLGGHVTLPQLLAHDLLRPDDTVFSVVRHPVARALSLHRLMLRQPDWFAGIREHIAEPGPAAFYAFCLEHRLFFPNGQCRYFALDREFATAKRALKEHVSLVGATEAFDRFAPALTALVRRELPAFAADPARINAAPPAPGEAIDPALIAWIEDTNPEDMALFAYIQRKHNGLYVARRYRGWLDLL